MIKGKKIIVMFMMLGLGTASLVGCGKKENTADAKGDSTAASGQMVEGQMNYELTTTKQMVKRTMVRSVCTTSRRRLWNQRTAFLQ